MNKPSPSPVKDSAFRLVRIILLFCMGQSIILFGSFWAYKRFSGTGNSFAKDTALAVQALRSSKSYEAALAQTEEIASNESEGGRQPSALTPQDQIEQLQKENARLKTDLWKLETKCRRLPNSST